MKALRPLLALLLAVAAHAGPDGLATAADAEDKRLAWVQPLGLAPFSEHFQWNAMCVLRTTPSAVPETRVYKDLMTGEVRPKVDNATATTMLRATTRDNIFVDSRFNASTCSGPADTIAWVQRITDEEAWRQLVRGKVDELRGADDDSVGSLWLLEIEAAAAAKGAVRSLPRDAHLHRRRGSSTVFAIAYLSVADARRFAAAWAPAAIFPAPDVFKLAPSAYILTNPDAISALHDAVATAADDDDDDDSGDGADRADPVELLAILHDPAPSGADDAEAATTAAEARAAELVQQCDAWLEEHNVPGKTERAPGSRRISVRLEDTRVQAIMVLLRRTLLPHPDVLFVEARERFKLHNQYATAITQNGTLADADAADVRKMYAKGLSGAGQIVGVGDSGLDVRSCFFYESASAFPQANTNNLYPDADKVVQYVAYADNTEGEFGGHGTHVAGSVAGYGGSSSSVTRGTSDEMEFYRGVAYNAKIAFFDMGTANSAGLAVPGDLYNNFLGISHDVGAYIHTNSWGTDVNSYTTTSRDMDRYSYDHQDFLVLVAGGNSGQAGTFTLGSPATAKNVLAVGASMSSAFGFSDDTTGPYCSSVGACTNYFEDMAGNLASFSSLGPSFDGRMKPDVVSVGFYVSSAYSAPSSQSCAVEAKAGTSMATPVTAGSAALIREYFVDQGIVPMGALLHAVLIHSAVPLADVDWERGFGNDFVQLDGNVDTNQGFGLVSLQNVLAFDDSPFELHHFGACSGTCEEADFADMPHVVDGGVFEQVFRVSAGDDKVPLSATLVWHGPAASSYTQNSVLINDLDLTVVAADGTVFLPLAPGGGTAVNRLDNAEKVQVPMADMRWGEEYTVRVTGTDVAVGPQPFALVVTASMAAEEVEDIVDDAVSNLQNSGALSGSEVQESSAGVAAGLGLAGFALFIALVVVLVLFQVQGKWAAMAAAATPAFLYVGVALRLAELAFGAAALALVVRDTRLVIFAATPPLSFNACGGAGPYLVVVTVLAIVGAIVVTALLLKFMLDTSVGLLRALAAADVLLVVLLLAAIIVAAVSSCGAYSLYYIPGALLCCMLLLHGVALCLLFARLATLDAALGGGGADQKQKGKKTQQEEGDKKPSKEQTVPVAAPAASASAAAAAAVAPPGPAPAPEVTVAVEKKEAPPPTLPKPTGTDGGVLATVKALYDYTAANPDELTFSEHDELDVTAVVDDGWARATCKRTKQDGLFPRNYCTGF